MKYALLFEELRNRDWLYKKYIDDKLSLNQIGKLIGCNHSAVRNALIKHKINIRSKGEGLRNAKRNGVDHFVFNKSVIEGALLGDGGLKKQNKYSDDSYPSFCKRNIHYDHNLYFSNILFSKNPEKRIIECDNSTGLGGTTIFNLSSLTHEELVPLYKEWYPKENNYIKVIPRSINMDKEVLLHWFMDDGYSYRVLKTLKGKKYNYIRVQFATQSFTKNDLDFICNKVYETFKLTITPRFHQRHGVIKGNGYFLELSNNQEQVEKFFEVIGTPPVPSLAYKWKKHFPKEEKIVESNVDLAF